MQKIAQASGSQTHTASAGFTLRSSFLIHSRSGFLNQWAMAQWWAIRDFALGHRAIQKISCLIQKVLFQLYPVFPLERFFSANQ